MKPPEEPLCRIHGWYGPGNGCLHLRWLKIRTLITSVSQRSWRFESTGFRLICSRGPDAR